MVLAGLFLNIQKHKAFKFDFKGFFALYGYFIEKHKTIENWWQGQSHTSKYKQG